MLSCEFIKMFIKFNGVDLKGAKFKIGRVLTASLQSGSYKGKVLAVNLAYDEYEYLIEGCPFLVWERELK